MKQIIEAAKEARMASAESLTTYGMHQSLDDFSGLSYDEIAESAFIKGAEWQAKQDPWISIDERMPEDNQLVLTSSSIYGMKLLVWNARDGVWDDEYGDDAYCERDKIDAWMPIPQ